MSDAYWRYGDPRQPASVTSLAGKRPHPDYDVAPSRELPGYIPRDEDRVALRVVRDTGSINASYERFLRAAQNSTYGGPERQGLVISSHAVEDHQLGNDSRIATNPRVASDPRIMSDPRMASDSRITVDPRLSGPVTVDMGMAVKIRTSSLPSGRAEISLPPDATNTLYVEGLPLNTSRREVAHIFRPFVGYKEVRLVIKEPKHSAGDPVALCFVDFTSPAHAATAMDAIQGYKFDEHDRDSPTLRLQFSRYPGPRSGGGHRGRR